MSDLPCAVRVPQLARNLSANHSAGRALANCAVVRLDVDDDGWLARSWAGEDLSVDEQG